MWRPAIVLFAAAMVGCGDRQVAGPEAREEAPRPKAAAVEKLTLRLGHGQTMSFVRIAPGKFRMGCEQGADNQRPAHEVSITKPFYLGEYEVTRGQFAAFVAATDHRTEAELGGGALVWRAGGFVHLPGAYWKENDLEQTDDHPVTCVSWNDAVAFCRWLSKHSGHTVRLPSEAEWEYACRAGTTTAFYTGETITSEDANYNGNRVYGPGKVGKYRETTLPVGQFRPNPWAVYDMHGNASEWVGDFFARYGQDPACDPTGPREGRERVIRGGGWSADPWDCLRSYERGINSPSYRNNAIGFRVAVEAAPD